VARWFESASQSNHKFTAAARSGFTASALFVRMHERACQVALKQ
jgi:hypothetical protein